VPKNKTKFSWQCCHCNKRNMMEFKGQFDMTKSYSDNYECSKCGKLTRLHIAFSSTAIGYKLTTSNTKGGL